MEKLTFRKRAVNHFRQHRGRYIIFGACLVFGGTIGTYTFINRRINKSHATFEDMAPLKDTVQTVVNSNDVIVENSLSLITHIGRNGHPGKVIYCNETKQLFKSHREATRELGIDSRDLWAYLKGLKSNARGYTFKTIGEAIATPV